MVDAHNMVPIIKLNTSSLFLTHVYFSGSLTHVVLVRWKYVTYKADFTWMHQTFTIDQIDYSNRQLEYLGFYLFGSFLYGPK